MNIKIFFLYSINNEIINITKKKGPLGIILKEVKMRQAEGLGYHSTCSPGGRWDSREEIGDAITKGPWKISCIWCLAAARRPGRPFGRELWREGLLRSHPQDPRPRGHAARVCGTVEPETGDKSLWEIWSLKDHVESQIISHNKLAISHN